MAAILSLLLVLTLSILVTRVATVALTHTGLSKQLAQLQARSAFTGVGFTTIESEKIVNHPVRRRVLMILMLLGNAGIVTSITSLMLTFIGDEGGPTALRVGVLIAGIAVLWALSSSDRMDRWLSGIIRRALSKYTRLDVQDYAGLLHLAGEYEIAELEVESKDWLAGKSLAESSLREEGVIVLGIIRADGTYVGTPRGQTRVEPNDSLILYGRQKLIQKLDQRSVWAGEYEHAHAVQEQREHADKEEEEDPVSLRRSTE